LIKAPVRMMSIDEILDTPDLRQGWDMLLQGHTSFHDCPDEADYDQWADGRELAMLAKAAATWELWVQRSTGRVPPLAEIVRVFKMSADTAEALLEAVEPYVAEIGDGALLHVIQAWASQRDGQTVGAAAVELEMPVETIIRVVPSIDDENALFFFREQTNRPFADQVFGFDGE